MEFFCKKATIIILVSVLLILVLEIFFRIIPFHTDTGTTRSGFVIPDEDLGWRLKPRSKGLLATNELGLRDTSYNPRADITILLLGDSVSWGNDLKDVKKGFPYLLEQRLRRQAGRTVEVINAGVPGYSTFQQLRYLQLYGIKLDPDLVILQFCLNDVVERYSAFAEYGGNNVFLGIDTRNLAQGINGRLLKISRLYEAMMRLAIHLWQDREAYTVRKMTADPLRPELKSAWDKTLSEIDDIRRISHDNHRPFMILVPPYRFQLDQPEKTNHPQKILRQYGNEHQVPVVDLLPYFSAWTGYNPDLALFTDANHLSFHGHQLAADTLVEPVLKIINKSKRP